MSWLFNNFVSTTTTTFGIILIIFLIMFNNVGHTLPIVNDQQQHQQTTEFQRPNQQQQLRIPHVEWNFLEHLNRTSAKLILQNEIENLRRLFPFINFHNNSSSTRSLIVVDNDNNDNDSDNVNNSDGHQQHRYISSFKSSELDTNSIIDANNDNENDEDDDDKDNINNEITEPVNKSNESVNGLLFLGSMFIALVIITLYLINSWSTRLDRRASIQTKTADNHKQPYTISV